MTIFRTKLRQRLAFAAACAALAAPARAGDGGGDYDFYEPSLYLLATGGYSVYKSALVQSNDTGVTVGYGFGVYAGKSHDIGLALKREQSTFTFALNNSKLAVSWQDVLLTYRLGYFHLGAAISSSAWQVAAPPDSDGDGALDTGSAAVAQDLLDITTTGYGGNAGFEASLGKKSSVFTDVSFVTTGAVQEKVVKDGTGAARLDRVVTLGPRMDVDIGGELSLLKWLNLRAGFKYRTYSLTIDSKASKESLNTTYAGLTAGWNL